MDQGRITLKSLKCVDKLTRVGRDEVRIRANGEIIRELKGFAQGTIQYFTWIRDFDNELTLSLEEYQRIGNQVTNLGSHTITKESKPPATFTVTGAQYILDYSIEWQNHPPKIEKVLAAPLSGAGSAPLTVEFTAQATDEDKDQLEYTWDFGDGSSQAGQQVTHEYQRDDTYTVRLSVSDGKTTDIETQEYVVQQTPEITIASLTIAPDSGYAPLDVFFEIEATHPDGAPLTYNWDFGDGESESGDKAAIVHHYAKPSKYSATIEVSSPHNKATISALLALDILPPIEDILLLLEAADESLSKAYQMVSVLRTA